MSEGIMAQSIRGVVQHTELWACEASCEPKNHYFFGPPLAEFTATQFGGLLNERANMFLNSIGRSAVIVVLDIALHQQCGPVALSGVCERTGLTLSYVEGICRKLRRVHIVKSVRGAQGGFLLARAADDVTVADIFRAVGELPVIHTGESRRGIARPSPYRGLESKADKAWASLTMQMIDYLSSVSLKDLMRQSESPGTGARVLAFPVNHRTASAG